MIFLDCYEHFAIDGFQWKFLERERGRERKEINFSNQFDNNFRSFGTIRTFAAPSVLLTSSNLLAMNENALSIVRMDPVTVTIRSANVPSDILILAPLCCDLGAG